MESLWKILIGMVFLLLGIPIGNFLKKITQEEMKDGQRYFKVIIVISLILGLVGLILRDDILMFSCFFIALVTSRSLGKKR